MPPQTSPGFGDPETWGPITDPRDPRHVEDESDIVDYDDQTLTIDELRSAAKDRQSDMSQAVYALSELRRAYAQNQPARFQAALSRLHELLDEECPLDVESWALCMHQLWLRKAGL